MSAEVLDGLRGVIDPETAVNLGCLGLVYTAEVRGGDVRVRLTMTTRACPLGESISEHAWKAIRRQIRGVTSVDAAAAGARHLGRRDLDAWILPIGLAHGAGQELRDDGRIQLPVALRARLLVDLASGDIGPQRGRRRGHGLQVGEDRVRLRIGQVWDRRRHAHWRRGIRDISAPDVEICAWGAPQPTPRTAAGARATRAALRRS